jgi:hypothetical protein
LKNNSTFLLLVSIISAALSLAGCGVYSMTGIATAAKSIQVDQFFNNTDLAPANIAQNFTNRVKDYYQQNSSMRVVQENGELQIEGIITGYALAPLASVPTAGAATPQQQTFTAALTRLTITVKVNYVDNVEPKNSFKDKTFSFYQDFDSNVNFSTVQEDLEKKIFDQILIDIFNATVANW